MPPSESEHRLERLEAAANESSRHLRGLHLSFVLFCGYLAVAVGSTTHEQFLREGNIKLPLLGVGVPTFWFYAIAPWLLILLHFSLLLQFWMHSSKLYSLRLGKLVSGATRPEQRALLDPFPFTQMLAGEPEEGPMRWLLRFVVWITVSAVPLLLLLWVQLRFVPYHNRPTNSMQHLALLVDLAMLMLFWRAILGPHGWWAGGRPAGGLLRCLALSANVTLGILLVVSSSLTGAVPAESGSSTRQGLDEWSRRIPKGYDAFRWIDRWFPENLEVTSQTLVEEPPSPELIGAYWMQGRSVEDAWREHARGLDLRGRDLRYADFQKARLINADLSDAIVQGSNFGEADLHGTVFTTKRMMSFASFESHEAQLQGCAFWLAQMPEVELMNAHLEAADFAGATMDGADLMGAKVHVAWGRYAQLSGGNLASAELQGSDLMGIQLQGSNLTSAQLQATDLTFAQIQGAYLLGAQLQGADLRGAQLQGADLRGADLWNAHFEKTNLSYADLRSARMISVSEEDRDGLIERVKSGLPKNPNRASAWDWPSGLRRLLLWLTDGKLPLSRESEPMSRQRAPLSVDAVTATGAIYDRADLFAGWPDPPSETDYRHNRDEYLAGLACGDARIAKALVWQSSDYSQRRGLPESFWREPRDLPRMLLERNCASVQELPPRIRTALENYVKVMHSREPSTNSAGALRSTRSVRHRGP
jgi:uncharacterized protein YjbI with pentapeptide repeats